MLPSLMSVIAQGEAQRLCGGGSGVADVQYRMEITWQRSLERDELAGRRVTKPKFGRMEKGPTRVESRSTAVVVPVPDDGMTDRSQMDADLVSATGLQAAPDQRHRHRLGEAILDGVVGDRMTTGVGHRHTGGVPVSYTHLTLPTIRSV